METCYAVKTINNTKGRGLVATKDIKKDDLILTDKPIVSCQFAWNITCGYLACDHCLRPLETAEQTARRLTGKQDLNLPFPQCNAEGIGSSKSQFVCCSACGVKYCSPECQVEADEQYHRTLCMQTTERDLSHPLEQLNETWKQMHYPPEVCSIMLVARMFALIHQSPNKDEAIEQFKQFAHSGLNENFDSFKLLGDKFKDNLEVLRELVIQTLPVEGLDFWLTREGFQSLFVLIGTNGQGIGTNSLTTWYHKCEEYLQTFPQNTKDEFESFIDGLYKDIEKHSGEFIDAEGSGLFRLQSLCNHSCNNNAQCCFPDGHFLLHLKATEDIKCGEEITISYIPECILQRSRHTRQKYLAENYMFHCKCEKCELQSGDPDETSDEDEEEDEEMDED